MIDRENGLRQLADAEARGDARILDYHMEIEPAYKNEFSLSGDSFRSRGRGDTRVQLTVLLTDSAALRAPEAGYQERETVASSRAMLAWLDGRLRDLDEQSLAERMMLWWGERMERLK